MTEKEIDLKLKLFKYNCLTYHDIVRQLEDIADKLSGEVCSLSIRSAEEAKYQRGTKIYKDNIPELMDNEEKLFKKRMHLLYDIEQTLALIDELTYEEHYLIYLKYWKEFTHQNIARIYMIDESRISRKINAIITKTHERASKICV